MSRPKKNPVEVAIDAILALTPEQHETLLVVSKALARQAKPPQPRKRRPNPVPLSEGPRKPGPPASGNAPAAAAGGQNETS